MCHLGVIQLNLVFIIIFSSRFRTPKTFDEENECVIIYSLQEQMSIADFSRMARPKSAQDLYHWARRTLVWMSRSSLKALKSWMPKVKTKGYPSSCRRLQISQVDDIPLGRFTADCLNLKRFLEEENGEHALNPLPVSDKRYYFNWFWKVLFVLCILTLCNLCCFFL